MVVGIEIQCQVQDPDFLWLTLGGEGYQIEKKRYVLHVKFDRNFMPEESIKNSVQHVLSD